MKSSGTLVNVELPLIVNSGAGKSSLIQRFLDEKFLLEDEASAIVGADLKVHKMRMSRKIKLIMYYVGISYDISFPSNYVIGLVDNPSTRTWSEWNGFKH